MRGKGGVISHTEERSDLGVVLGGNSLQIPQNLGLAASGANIGGSHSDARWDNLDHPVRK